MVGPGVRDQADVGLAMNTGTMAAKEAGFSVGNDVSKYFAIIPAMFMATYPALGKLNIMHLRTPQSAVLAAVIFNADLLTSSGSGLDPDISPASAEAQVARVAAARGLTVERVRRLVAENAAGRQFGVLGEPRVNVLKLNIALDEAAPVSK